MSVVIDGTNGISSPAIDLITPLAIADGGTNTSATPLLGGIAYGDGTSYQFIDAGTSGQKLMSFGAAQPAWRSSSVARVFTSGSGTYTIPEGCTAVKVTVVGGGGNGGGAVNSRGTGGSAGGVAIKWLAVTPGGTLSYTVGGIGTSSTVSSGTITITTITGTGGATGTTTAFAASLTLGPPGGSAINGDINISGQRGGTSWGTSTTVGTNNSGLGASGPFGEGGQMIAVFANDGQSATGFGAGGGGSLSSATVGSGTGGLIIFEPY